MENAVALTTPGQGNARRARRAGCRDPGRAGGNPPGPRARKPGNQPPAPRPASAQLPRPAPPRARPSPCRAPRRSHQPARPPAIPGTEAGARGRRAELVGGSGSLGGDKLSTRPRRPRASFLPGRRAGLRDRPLPPPGRLRAAPRFRLHLQPSEPRAGRPAPGERAAGARSPGRAGGLRLSRGPWGAWRRPGSFQSLGRGGVPGPFRRAPRGGRASWVERG